MPGRSVRENCFVLEDNSQYRLDLLATVVTGTFNGLGIHDFFHTMCLILSESVDLLTFIL